MVSFWRQLKGRSRQTPVVSLADLVDDCLTLGRQTHRRDPHRRTVPRGVECLERGQVFRVGAFAQRGIAKLAADAGDDRIGRRDRGSLGALRRRGGARRGGRARRRSGCVGRRQRRVRLRNGGRRGGGWLACCRSVLGGNGYRNKLPKHQGKTNSNDGDKRSSTHMRFPPNPKRLVRERHNCHYVLRWRSNARFTMKGLLVTRKPSLPPVFHPILYLPDRGRLWILIHGYTPTRPCSICAARRNRSNALCLRRPR